MATGARVEVKEEGRVTLRGGGWRDAEAIAAIAGVRTVTLEGCRVGPGVLRRLARLPELEAVRIFNARLGASDYRSLMGLPPGASVVVVDQGHFDPEDMAFREKRAALASRLGRAGRRDAALRKLRGLAQFTNGFYEPSERVARFNEGDVRDADLRFLAWLPELEELHCNRTWGLTSACLRHLSRLEHLKVLSLGGIRFTEPLSALGRRTSLEALSLASGEGFDIGAADLAGLERLTGLRRLFVVASGLADETLARLAPLKRLRRLEIGLACLRDPDGLRALAGLRDLEVLSFGAGGAGGEWLRHLAGSGRLHTLEVGLDEGDGEGMRHLAGLSSLRLLTLSGEGVTDAGLRHLAGLDRLRIVQVPLSRVTKAGAAWLAGALPGVAVHYGGGVAKSPRTTFRFRRVDLGGVASVLLPAHWDIRRGADGIEATEDGATSGGAEDFELYAASVEPARIRPWIDARADARDAGKYLRSSAWEDDIEARARRLEELRLGWPEGVAGAAVTYLRYDERYLTAAILLGDGRAAVVDCTAPPRRFRRFRKLFEFIAVSLRPSTTAEIVDVPAARFE